MKTFDGIPEGVPLRVNLVTPWKNTDSLYGIKTDRGSIVVVHPTGGSRYLGPINILTAQVLVTGYPVEDYEAPQPEKPAEPMGYDVRVTDVYGLVWVRVSKLDPRPWQCLSETRAAGSWRLLLARGPLIARTYNGSTSTRTETIDKWTDG